MRKTVEIRIVRAPRTCRGARRGYSLLELLAVMAMIGLLALAAVANFRPETFGNMGAKVDARRLALDLMQTRRRAIATGDNHFLLFKKVAGKPTYQIHRRIGRGKSVAVDSVRNFPDMVKVSVKPPRPEFNFEGAALAACSIQLSAPNRTWQITVAQATGSVSVVEL